MYLNILLKLLKLYWFLPFGLLLYGGLLLGLKFFRPQIKGFMGEMQVALSLWTLPKKDYMVLNNLMINSKRGSSQIDHIIVSIYGVFVLETKNYKGWIYGGKYEKTWTQNIFGNKFYFQNPLHQNYGHIQSLLELNKLFREHIDFVSIVAFSDQCQLKNQVDNVTYFSGLKKLIKSYDQVLYSRDDMKSIHAYLKRKNIRDPRKRKLHVKRIQARLASK